MKSLEDSEILTQLVTRLSAVRPDTPRQWGTMTAGEMLCHLGDATASVIDAPPAPDTKGSRLLKWFALNVPLAWPRGLKTPASVDPKAGGTKPSDFESDRRRAIEGLRQFAAASAHSLSATHGAFGPMTPKDWYRWAYRHTDHHLRQFGV